MKELKQMHSQSKQSYENQFRALQAIQHQQFDMIQSIAKAQSQSPAKSSATDFEQLKMWRNKVAQRIDGIEAVTAALSRAQKDQAAQSKDLGAAVAECSSRQDQPDLNQALAAVHESLAQLQDLQTHLAGGLATSSARTDRSEAQYEELRRELVTVTRTLLAVIRTMRGSEDGCVPRMHLAEDLKR